MKSGKWLVKSVGGLVANLVLLTVWVDGLGMDPALAIVPNFVIISITGYAVANHWIWPDGVSPVTWRGHARQYAGMQAANMVGKAGNYGVYLLLLPVADYRVAWVVGAGVTFALTFGLNNWWWSRAVPERS